MILVIDNYDSFTYNLVHYVGDCGAEVVVRRNDDIDVRDALDLQPEKIIISPGPCTPKEAGISEALILASTVPVLGVCLGHQAIGSAFGGQVVKAPSINHGKISSIQHDGAQIFEHIASPCKVVRYHSLVVAKDSLPEELLITATLEDDANVIMGLQHKSRPIYGVQFHPESIETDYGKQIIKNFLAL